MLKISSIEVFRSAKRLNVDTATGRPPKTLIDLSYGSTPYKLEKCVVYQSRIAEEKGGPTQQKLNLKQQPLRVRSISKEEQEKLEKDPTGNLQVQNRA
jgi:hypothetical protein